MMNLAQDHNSRPSTMQRPLSVALENIDGLLDEAVENLALACGAFAFVDGTSAMGEVTGSDPEDRENFNIAVARANTALRCIRRELANLQRSDASGILPDDDGGDEHDGGAEHAERREYDAEE